MESYRIGSWTLSNGATPYYVEFLLPESNEGEIIIEYPLKTKAIIYKNHIEESIEYYYKTAFPGIDIKRVYDNMNSILLELDENKYVFIGNEIYEFETREPILEFESPIGNSDVPYPYAISANYVYLFLEHLYFEKKYMGESINLPRLRTYAVKESDKHRKNHFSPYDVYYSGQKPPIIYMIYEKK